MPEKAFAKIAQLSKSAALLEGVQMVLDWDKETYMPKEAIEQRSEQLEMIASLIHRQRTSKAFTKALSALIDIETGEMKNDRLSQEQMAALREWRRDYLHSVKLPNAFVKQYAKTISNSSHVWQMAKEHNDFKSFAPHLEKVVKLSRKKADLLGFTEHPYDALLDLYEPGMKTSFLTPLFSKLKIALTELIRNIAIKPPIEDHFLFGHCSKAKQMEFSHQLLRCMGFHFSRARLDISAHPFCTGISPKETRMTTRIHPDNVMLNIGAVLHEGGHGLYNSNLPIEHYGTPLGQQVSLGIDESQSRWWETLIGQCAPFWKHFFPLLQQEFPEQFLGVGFDAFYHAINSVKPGFIRIDADEVTYNLHIIVRFEIEKGLIEGSIRVKDVPDIWNEKMREYLGICPEFDGQGCLQDIHWSLGYIGYFPTYTLGNLYAVQFFKTFEKQHPDWQEKVAQGSLEFIGQWLKENIHSKGRQFLPSDLCQQVTGSRLSVDPYITYLTQKYSSLYSL